MIVVVLFPGGHAEAHRMPADRAPYAGDRIETPDGRSWQATATVVVPFEDDELRLVTVEP